MKRKRNEKNLPLANQLVCTSGFDPEENNELISKITENGGQYCDNLIKGTNYLISSRICTKKSQQAQNQRITIVTKEWLNPSSEKYLKPKECLAGCFQGVKFFLFGFDTIETLPSMRKTIRLKGGHIRSNYSKCDVIIFKSGLLLTENEKIEISKYENKIVTEKWYYQSLSANKFLPLDLEKFDLNNDFIQTKYTTLIKSVIDEGREDSNKKKTSKESASKMHLFLGKIFYIASSFDKQTRNILSLSISVYHGLVYNNITPLTNYVICTSKSDMKNIINEISDYNENSQPQFVTYDFLYNSIKEGQIEDSRKYRPFNAIGMMDDEPDYMFEDDEDEYNSSSEYDIETANAKRRGRRKKAILSSIFKGETFTIINETYTQEEVDELIEKIIQNGGKIIDSKGDFFANKKGKFIVMNDNFGPLLTILLQELEKNQDKFIVVSHRFIDKCIQEQVLLNITDYLTLIPFNFSVPHQDFLNKIEVYIVSSHFAFHEIRSLEDIIETLGGKVDLSPNTTHVLIGRDIRKKEFDSIKKKTNNNIKIMDMDWLFEFVVNNNINDQFASEFKIID